MTTASAKEIKSANFDGNSSPSHTPDHGEFLITRQSVLAAA
jgi:hypothetical protein